MFGYSYIQEFCSGCIFHKIEMCDADTVASNCKHSKHKGWIPTSYGFTCEDKDTDTLDDFIGKEGKQINYGDLYEHLCSAQYIADVLQDEHAYQIMEIRQEVGNTLLKIHEDKAKC